MPKKRSSLRREAPWQLWSCMSCCWLLRSLQHGGLHPHCGSQYQLCSSWLISRLGVNVWCEQRYSRFKMCASVLYLMRTMRLMHHFEHRTRREATVVARTYLLEHLHYCRHPLTLYFPSLTLCPSPWTPFPLVPTSRPMNDAHPSAPRGQSIRPHARHPFPRHIACPREARPAWPLAASATHAHTHARTHPPRQARAAKTHNRYPHPDPSPGYPLASHRVRHAHPRPSCASTPGVARRRILSRRRILGRRRILSRRRIRRRAGSCRPVPSPRSAVPWWCTQS